MTTHDTKISDATTSSTRTPQHQSKQGSANLLDKLSTFSPTQAQWKKAVEDSVADNQQQ